MLTLYIDKLDMAYLVAFQALLHQAITLRHCDENTIEIVYEGQVRARLICLEDAHNEGHSPLAQLTPKQEQVLALLGLGLKNQEIGQKLGIAEKTVEKHVSAILHKLELKSRSQAALIANRRYSRNFIDGLKKVGFSPPAGRENPPKL
jgi:DNA-binding NarL/FixJ family response regulator